MSPRILVALVAVASALTACTAADASSSGDAASGDPSAGAVAGVDVPLPTIGLGSETGSVGGSGAGSFRVAADAASIERLVMIGDSITVGSEELIADGFDAVGLPVEISAQVGKRIDVSTGNNASGTRIAELLSIGSGAGGDVAWVVALGTNDIGQFSEQAEVEQEISDLVAYVPAEAPLIWINTWSADRLDETAMVNAAIASVVGARPDTVIADWSSIAPIEGVLFGDGVHPTDDGAQVFADLVVGTVRTFLQR